MTPFSAQSRTAWELARGRHWIITRGELLGLGFTPEAIRWRLARGRLFELWPGVYAVGRREVTAYGRWTAAVLAAGADAVLSHSSGAALWQIAAGRNEIAVSVPVGRNCRLRGIRAHRRSNLRDVDVVTHHGIPVTTPVATLVDLAATVRTGDLERAINEADRLELVDPVQLRVALDGVPRRPGVGQLRRVLDQWTFALTRSELERRFLPIARAAGLPKPRTLADVNGFEVDFYWPQLGLVVETDGLRYHRTPAQQARDRLRDQAHAVAGLTPLRFTHAQIAYQPRYVEGVLREVAQRLMNERSAVR
jgi:very-short-patch-repair endonuclease